MEGAKEGIKEVRKGEKEKEKRHTGGKDIGVGNSRGK